jgi:hypothetical protein
MEATSPFRVPQKFLPNVENVRETYGQTTGRHKEFSAWWRGVLTAGGANGGQSIK